MKSQSERFVSAIVGFIAGNHMHRKARISTYSLFSESRNVRRQIRELERMLDAIERKK